MTAQKKDVFFFIRAYNDLDIQMSLIREFAMDERFQPRVIFYPGDGFISQANDHEMISHIEKTYGVIFQNLLAMKETPSWIRYLFHIQDKVYAYRRSDKLSRYQPLSFLLKLADVGLRKIMRPALLKKNPRWVSDLIKVWNPFLAFTDEILFQKGRDPLIDNVIPKLKEKGAHIYAILTGHRVYLDINPSGQQTNTEYNPSIATCYFVPSAHNKSIYTALFPHENITIAGNLRMNPDWIHYLHQNTVTSKPDLPQKPVKIAMMLSKINYGVELQALQETIRTLGHMEHVALAIKPHTRGMKFNFMSQDEIGDAMIADKTPSTALIDWADIVLITGSSIVFHAMILGKQAGFLKYCQKLRTIFDDQKSCLVFQSLDELKNYIGQSAENGLPALTQEQKEKQDTFLQHEVYGDLGHGKIAQNYKDIIMENIGLQDLPTKTKAEARKTG